MRRLLDLLLPPTCAGCDREGSLLCDRCAAPLRRRLQEPAGAPLGLPVSTPAGIVQLEWCATYSGSVRAVLHALKYGGIPRLAEPLGAVLAERWGRAGAGGELLTWVPAHASRSRERGYDQAALLAKAVARESHLPVQRCLERSQRTKAQHALDQNERAGNIAGVFVVPADAVPVVRDRWVIVVDDIVTTGATLAGCAAALHAAGARAVSALCVARDR